MTEKKQYRRAYRYGSSTVIVIPKSMVDAHGIESGQLVEFVNFEDRMELIPVRTQHTSSKEGSKTKYDRVLDDMMEKADLPADKLKKLHIK